MSDYFGPALPPGFNSSAGKEDKSKVDPGSPSSDAQFRTIGPCLPPGFSQPKTVDEDGEDELSYGPALPPGLKSSQGASVSHEGHASNMKRPASEGSSNAKRAKTESESSSDSSSDSSSSEDEGKPQKQFSHIVGPSLPPNLGPGSSHDAQQCGIGPVLPPGMQLPKSNCADDYEEDDDVYGPLPGTAEGQQYSAAEEFERRAQKMKRKLDGSDEKDAGPAERDSWMTELPNKLSQAFSGTTARKFRANPAPEISDADRSIWTDTPADKERKEREESEGKHKHRKKKHEHKVKSERDKHMRRQVEEYNKASKRGKSLLDMHQKKLKKKKREKKKKGEKEKTERRPFDRDTDLQTHVIDDAKRKAMIKRASNLGGRFGHGGVEFL